MKKFAVLSLVGLLIVAFAITAYAQEKAPVLEFKASGWIDIDTEYLMNVANPGWATSAAGATSTNNVVYGPPVAYLRPTVNGANDRAFDKTMSYVMNRGRLKFDAIMGKQMSGTFYFEFDSTRWGERAPAAADQRQYAGHWGVADRGALELKNMFLTFGVPVIPVPMTVQAGILPFAIRPAFFLLVDGPGVTGTVKLDPATIKLAWMKALENFDWAADDADLYAIEANAKIQALTAGGYFVFFNSNTYPMNADGAGLTVSSPNYSSAIWWAGAYLDGKLGPVNLNLDFIYDKGKVEDRRDLAAKARDVKFGGWATMVNVSYPWEKFLFGFASTYGSGADQKKTAANPLPGAATPWGTVSTKNAAYVIPGGTEGGAGGASSSLVLTGNGINRMNTGFEPANDIHGRAPFGGLWISKLYGSLRVTPAFKTTLEAMYIRDTTDNGNTIGNALKADGRPRNDSDVGWEIDWLNSLSIYKNLTFQFGGGMLFAGDAMDYAVIGAANGTNKGPKNPWVITTNLNYSF